MHESLSRSTFEAVVEHLSAEEKSSSLHASSNASFNHRPQPPSLRTMSGQALDATVETVAPCDRNQCKPSTSQTVESPQQMMPVLRDMSSASPDALKLRNSSDELDGYCSSYEGSLPDDSVGSSSEFTSRTGPPANLAATLHGDYHKPHHHRPRPRQCYRGRRSSIRNAARDEERQHLVAMSFDESAAIRRGVEGQLAPSMDSATTTAALPVTPAKAVSATGGVAREISFKGIHTPYPKPITVTKITKTSVAMISAALNVANCSAEAAKRTNRNSPHSVPLSVVGNTSDKMLLKMQAPLLTRDEEGESTGLLRFSTTSQLSQSFSNHSDAAEASTDGAAGDECCVEPPSTAIPRSQQRSSPTSTSNLASDAVIMTKGSSNGSNSGTAGMLSALRATSSGSTAAPPFVERAHGVSVAADLMKGNAANAKNGSGARAADASDTLQEVVKGLSAEPNPDKKQLISAADTVASDTAGVADVATVTSKNETFLLRDPTPVAFAKNVQVTAVSPNRFDPSSSSSVGGHHLSVTEGSAFLKQSGSRREEAFYNMIRPYQEALVREAVRQAPHTVRHWNGYHSGTPCAGSQEGAVSAVYSHSRAGYQSQLHSSIGCRSSDDDGDGVEADPDDVAAMCEARWEAYQQYEAEDMSSLSILASEQLSERGAQLEHQRGSRDSDCTSLLHGDPSSPTVPRQVDKDLVALAARLWWTVRFRYFYRTSAPAYEVQRQAAEAAGLSPQSPSACPPAPNVSDSGGAAITNSWCSTPAPQQSSSLSASPPLQESTRGRRDPTVTAPPPNLPMSPSMIERQEAAHTGEAAVALIPSVSGTATPCMASSFAASLLDGLAGSASAAERQYAMQKHRALQLLAAFVPRYYGTRCLFARDVLRCEKKGMAAAVLTAQPNEGQRQQKQLGERQQIVVDADNDEDDNNRGGEQKMCRMIMLEYVCYRFRRPCVMDIKMGSRQYGLHPSAEKKQSKEHKAKLSTSARHGIRLSGYRRWNAKEGQYNSRSKLQCRCLSLNEVKSEVSAFLLHSREMERVFRRQLQRLRVAFSQQTVFRFYTSSLLFVYDAEDPLKTARVTMVDFAYTYESRELQQGGDSDADFDYDVGYLKAIDTLLSLLA